jgi:phage-related protein
VVPYPLGNEGIKVNGDGIIKRPIPKVGELESPTILGPSLLPTVKLVQGTFILVPRKRVERFIRGS